MDEYTQCQINAWAAQVFLELQNSRDDKWRDLYNRAPSALFAVAEKYQQDMDRITAILEKHVEIARGIE